MHARAQSKIWQHVASGGLYTVVAHAVPTGLAVTAPVTVYRSLWDGAIWVCPMADFYGGQFRNLAVDEVADCGQPTGKDET